MSVPTIFLSFAREDASWVQQFTEPQWFITGPETILRNYDEGDNLPFGSIRAWIEGSLSNASAVIAFVSEDYIGKKYPNLEWAETLRKIRNQNIVFVPVLLDAHALKWWQKQKSAGGLTDLGDDYAFANFSLHGKRQIIVSTWPNQEVTDRIQKLAGLVRKLITERSNPPPPGTIDRPAHSGSVVLLGHPMAATLEEIRTASATLAKELGANVEQVPDAWRSLGPKLEASLAQSPSMIVQPMTDIEALDHAPDFFQPRGWLEEAVVKNETALTAVSKSRITIWVPPSIAARSARIREIVSTRPAEANPILRADAPETLAHWLVHGGTRNIRGPILVLPELAHEAVGSTMRDVAASLGHALSRLAEAVLPKDQDLDSPIIFPVHEFGKLFTQVAERRPILALTDDLARSGEATLGKIDRTTEFKRYLRTKTEEADAILKSKGLTAGDVFWLACLRGLKFEGIRVPNSDLLRWNVLHIQLTPNGIYIEPDSEQRAHTIKENLCRWAGVTTEQVGAD